MATASEIRQRVFDNLYGIFPTESPFLTRLTASYSSGATSLTVVDEDNWSVGDVVENIETGEQFYVTAVTTNDTHVLTVIPGHNSTTQAASVGTDDVLRKNPRFSIKVVDDAVTTTLAALEKWGIYAFGNGTITRADPKEFYELSETDIIDDIGVIQLYDVTSSSEVPRALPFRYQYGLGTGPSEYSQGQGVHVYDWGETNDTGTVYFIYAKQIAATTDLLTRQEDLVIVGAVALLLGGTVVPATHDPGARTDRTIQPGQTARDVRYFQGRFITEARLEAGKLSVERQRMLRESPRQARARRWRG